MVENIQLNWSRWENNLSKVIFRHLIPEKETYKDSKSKEGKSTSKASENVRHIWENNIKLIMPKFTANFREWLQIIGGKL